MTLPAIDPYPAEWDTQPGEFYDRDGNRITFRQWVACTEDQDYRWVAHDVIAGRPVATYWVGLPMTQLTAGEWMRLICEGPRPDDDTEGLAADPPVPLLYETVVPALRLNRRYPDAEAARAGHAEALALLRLDVGEPEAGGRAAP